MATVEVPWTPELEAEARGIAKKAVASRKMQRDNGVVYSAALEAAREALSARLTSSQSNAAEIAQARAEAFEEAARVAEGCKFPDGWVGNDGQIIIATAIRALKEKTDGK